MISFILISILYIVSSFFWTKYILFKFNNKEYISEKLLFVYPEILIVFFTQIVLSGLLFITILKPSNLNYLFFGILSFILAYFTSKNSNVKFEKIPTNTIKTYSILILTPVLLYLFFEFFYSLISDIYDLDALTYHLPMVVDWIQGKSLLNISNDTTYQGAFFYPSNYNLFYLFIITISKSDQFLKLSNFFLIPIMLIVPYKFGKKIGIPNIRSLLLTIFSFLMPLFLGQIGNIYVDYFTGATFLVAVFNLYFYSNEKQPYYLVFSSLSLSLFLGSKYSSLVFSLPFFLYIFYLIYKDKNIKFTDPKSLTITALCILTGITFYIRNILITGNPIFPAEISLGGITFFKGSLSAKYELSNSSIFDNFNIVSTPLELLQNISLSSGLSGLFLFLISLLSINVIFFKKTKNHKRIFLISLFSWYIFIFYIFMPNTYVHLIYNIRYLFPLFILSIFTLFLLVNAIKNQIFQKVLTGLIFILSIIVFKKMIDNPWYKTDFIINEKTIPIFESEITYLYMFVLLISITFLVHRYYKKNLNSFLITMTLLLLIFAGTEHTQNLKEKYQKNFDDLFFIEGNFLRGQLDISRWIDTNLEQPTKIAYSNIQTLYHLYDNTFKNNLVYININKCTSCKYNDYKDFKNGYRSNPNKSEWINNIFKEKPNYVVVSNGVDEMYPIELDWMKQEPGIFKQIFRTNNSQLYEVKLP